MCRPRKVAVYPKPTTIKELAGQIFEGHPVYGPAYEQAQTAKAKNVWA